MSKQELSRLDIIVRLNERRIKQQDAAELLSLSVRQVQRLLWAYRIKGADGLVNAQRGKPPNNRLCHTVTDKVIGLISERYYDFGPTLATEKLAELHDIQLSKETVRNLMIRSGLWKTRSQKLKRAFQPRYRRDCYGELVQIDGSDHAWFEDRGPNCTLLVYIDDATSKLMILRFVLSESTFSYFEATQEYLISYGKPVAFYSDKHSVFRANKKGALAGDGVTQFGRALDELNVDIICANTSQAKGRVERANKTLQDRLVKELRLQNISNINQANAFLPDFMADHNSRFAKPPLNNHDAHRPVRDEEDLTDIFCWQEERTLSSNLTLQYDKKIYLIKDVPATRKIKNKRVIIHDYYDGSIKIKYQNQTLEYSIFDKLQRVDQGQIVENKRLGAVLALIDKKQSERDEKRSKSAPSRSHLGQESTHKMRGRSAK